MKKLLFILLFFAMAAQIAMAECDPVKQEDPETQTICYNKSTTILLDHATGGDANNVYLWQQSSDKSVWSDATGENSKPDYTTPNLASDMYYRRQVVNGCDENDMIYSEPALITVRNQFTAGAIETTGQTVTKNLPALVIGNEEVASGGDDIISYRWKENGVEILGAEDLSYTPPTTELGTFKYQREAKDKTCASWTESEGVWKLIVKAPSAAPSITLVNKDTTVCNGITSTSFEYTDPQNNPTHYRIESENFMNMTDYVALPQSPIPIVGIPVNTTTNDETYPGKIYVKNAADEVSEPMDISITVHPQFKPGKIDATGETICINGDAAEIGSLEPAGGGSGTIKYRWFKGTDSISGAILATYKPESNVAGVFEYRREAQAEACADWTNSEGIWKLTISSVPSPPDKPEGLQIVCQSTTATYHTSKITGATGYIWALSPANAGTVTGSGDIVSIDWSSTFSGTAQLKVKAMIPPCGETAFSDPFEVTVKQMVEVQFSESVITVCAKQKGAVYCIHPIADVTYQWEVENGKIAGGNGTPCVTVDWIQTIASAGGKVTVTATDQISQCKYTAQLTVTILAQTAPQLNDIVAKKNERGEAYILIYPNPVAAFQYQWYENNVKIEGAREQFYYPSKYEKELLVDGNYKVYIADPETTCGNFTDAYKNEQSLGKNSSECFYVFPNPVNQDGFTISFNPDVVGTEGSEMTLRITSFIGEKVYECKLKSRDDFQFTKTLKKGSYLISVDTKEKGTFTKKIIVL